MLNYSNYMDNDIQSGFLNDNSGFADNNIGDFSFNNQAQEQDDLPIQALFNVPKDNLRENNILTKPTSILALDSDSKINSNDNKKCFESLQIISKEIEPKEIKNYIGKKRGRKLKGYTGPRKHSKSDRDNIVKKIKGKFAKHIHEKLNGSLHFTYKRFLSLNKRISTDLTKDYNIKLMEKTIKQIYEENTPSNRYDTSNEVVKNKNKLMIKEIFDKNEETETMKI